MPDSNGQVPRRAIFFDDAPQQQAEDAKIESLGRQGGHTESIPDSGNGARPNRGNGVVSHAYVPPSCSGASPTTPGVMGQFRSESDNIHGNGVHTESPWSSNSKSQNGASPGSYETPAAASTNGSTPDALRVKDFQYRQFEASCSNDAASSEGSEDNGWNWNDPPPRPEVTHMHELHETPQDRRPEHNARTSAEAYTPDGGNGVKVRRPPADSTSFDRADDSNTASPEVAASSGFFHVNPTHAAASMVAFQRTASGTGIGDEALKADATDLSHDALSDHALPPVSNGNLDSEPCTGWDGKDSSMDGTAADHEAFSAAIRAAEEAAVDDDEAVVRAAESVLEAADAAEQDSTSRDGGKLNTHESQAAESFQHAVSHSRMPRVHHRHSSGARSTCPFPSSVHNMFGALCVLRALFCT
jgi:hypothetical protein